ncbi:reverse transcriptase domain-containing protein [Tanacetum coccineum]
MENTNRAIKRILERTINKNRKEWTDKLDDALWAFITAYKSPIGNAVGRNRFLHLNKLAEMRNEAYEHSRAYKERTKRQVFPYGTIEVCGKDGIRFKFNGHRLKKYYGEGIETMKETLYFTKT